MSESIKKIQELIKKKTHFVIMYHENPDGDCIANALLWGYFLSERKKQYRIVGADPFPERLAFLTERYSKITNNRLVIVPRKKSMHRALPSQFKDAVLIVVDTSSLERTGRIKDDIDDFSMVINIDHHADNDLFGDINYIDKKASSVGQVSYEFLTASRFKLDKTSAELLYISLYTDTGAFSQRNTNKRTLEIMSELIGYGTDVPALNGILKMRSYAKTILLGRVLARIKDVNRKLYWAYVTVKDLRDLNLAPYDTDGLIEEILAIAGSEVVALFKEVNPSLVRISLRSRSEFNVKPLANKYKGGGHDKAAGCEIEGTIDAVQSKLVAELTHMMGIR